MCRSKTATFTNNKSHQVNMLLINNNNIMPPLLQVYTRLNHVNIALSCKATLAVMTKVSEHHKVPLSCWIAKGLPFKFVGDNVDKKKGVRDIRTDHRAEMIHMYSLLAVQSRVLSPVPEATVSVPGFASLPPSAFLPTPQDITAIHDNLMVLVSRVLCKHMKPLSFLSKVLPAHISHRYSSEMAKKSVVVVLDLLQKNETKNTDMLDIMQTMQGYLGEEFCRGHRVLSGGDQLTCERQVNCKRHLMDGDTPWDRMDALEPVTEDWHALLSLFNVSEQLSYHFYIV